MLRRISATRSFSKHVTHHSPRVTLRAKHQCFSNIHHQKRNVDNAPTTTSDSVNTFISSPFNNYKEEEIYNPRSLPSLTTLFPQSTTAANFHNDLPSFLAYARRTGLDPASTVYRGTRYEYLVQETLKRYGFELVRVGGRGDLGWDLVGYWRLPFGSPGGGTVGEEEVDRQGMTMTEQRKDVENVLSDRDTAHSRSYTNHRIPIKVLIQCKHLTGKSKISPHLVRELEGAFRGAPPGWKRQEDGVLGLFVTMKPATKGVMQAMRLSERAAGWLLIEVDSEENGGGSEKWNELEEGHGERIAQREIGKGRVKQILWNQKAKEVGLEGVDVVKRYGEDGQEEVVLMHKGKTMNAC